jgi:hypothetical protein
MPWMSLIASDLLRGGVLGVEARRLAEDVIVKVFCPLSPRKFVFMSGAAAIVPPSTSGEHERRPRVRRVQRRIGR